MSEFNADYYDKPSGDVEAVVTCTPDPDPDNPEAVPYELARTSFATLEQAQTWAKAVADDKRHAENPPAASHSETL